MHLIIKGIVDDLVKKHGTRDPFELAKKMNSIVVYQPLIDVNGFYKEYKGINLIFIDSSLSDIDKRVVCSHEIGHIVLHKKFNYFFLNEYSYREKEIFEDQADLFASELLISDVQYKELSKNAFGGRATLEQIQDNIQSLQVDSKTFLWKVRNYQKAQEIELHKPELIGWCYEPNPLKNI